ncbi:phage major capsid protein [Peijinzhouia sedimentorum]
MPANFPEVWLNRVETNLRATDVAPWLDGVEEMDTQVIEMGSGTASETNVIHIATSEFEPTVLINNTTYPLNVQPYTDGSVTLNLDKYQTLATSVSDDQVMGASYNRIDAATRTHVQVITKSKYAKAIHAIAPAANTSNTPVIGTTGAVEGGASFGRKIFTYKDLVTLKGKFDDLEVPEIGRRIVLCTDHWNDLLLDRDRFGDNFSNYRTGGVAPMVAGFEIYQYVANPIFDTSFEKLAYGAVPDAGEFKASIAFYVPNISKKTGFTKQYFAPANLDPKNQQNLLNYRHYFMALPKRNKYIGAICSTFTVDPG